MLIASIAKRILCNNIIRQAGRQAAMPYAHSTVYNVPTGFTVKPQQDIDGLPYAMRCDVRSSRET